MQPPSATLKNESSFPLTPIRWNIVLLLTGFSIVSYLQRMNISIAAKFMKPELGFTDVQMGRVFSAFMLGYALFQIPAGTFGDRRGPRFVLAVAALGWGITTLLTGFLPGMVLTGTAALGLLMVVRFSLGVAEAATYPVAARAISNWLPSTECARAISIVTAGLSIGSAATPPLISWLMVRVGWRASFYIAAIPAF